MVKGDIAKMEGNVNLNDFRVTLLAHKNTRGFIMANASALLIGLKSVDPTCYDGWRTRRSRIVQ